MMITEVSYSKPRYRKKLLALQQCYMRWVEASHSCMSSCVDTEHLCPTAVLLLSGELHPMLLPHGLVESRPHKQGSF